MAHLDLYSCFASSLAFARDALGIADGRGLTVTGGLPYHGGPGSNYGTHSLAAMVETLRVRPRLAGAGHRHRDAHDPPRRLGVLSTLPGDFTPPGGAAACRRPSR